MSSSNLLSDYSTKTVRDMVSSIMIDYPLGRDSIIEINTVQKRFSTFVLRRVLNMVSKGLRSDSNMWLMVDRPQGNLQLSVNCANMSHLLGSKSSIVFSMTVKISPELENMSAYDVLEKMIPIYIDKIESYDVSTVASKYGSIILNGNNNHYKFVRTNELPCYTNERKMGHFCTDTPQELWDLGDDEIFNIMMTSRFKMFVSMLGASGVLYFDDVLSYKFNSLLFVKELFKYNKEVFGEDYL